MKFFKKAPSLSVIFLILVNLIPIGGVFFAGWDVASIVLLYWAENIVLGFYNVLKMAFVRVERPIYHLGKLFDIPFFCIHYSGFCAGHGFFLIMIFKIGGGDADSILQIGSWPGPLVFLELLVSVFRYLWNTLPWNMFIAIGGLFLSHGISFVQHYIIGREYQRLTLGQLMAEPYKRIVILHVAIIAGGIFVMMLGSPVVLLLIIVILKIVLDLYLHFKSHRIKNRNN